MSKTKNERISIQLDTLPSTEKERYQETPVFVYGSLKQGFGNHLVLGGSRLLGEAVTCDAKFGMGSYKAYPACFVDHESATNVIHGEAYSVNRNILRRLDQLESNGVFYKRERVSVQLLGTDTKVDAWMYLLLLAPPPTCHRVKTFQEIPGVNALTWAKN